MLTIYQFLRPRWTGLYAARKRQKNAASSLPELPDTFLGWLPALYRITEEEVLASAGLDAFVVSDVRGWSRASLIEHAVPPILQDGHQIHSHNLLLLASGYVTYTQARDWKFWSARTWQLHKQQYSLGSITQPFGPTLQ